MVSGEPCGWGWSLASSLTRRHTRGNFLNAFFTQAFPNSKKKRSRKRSKAEKISKVFRFWCILLSNLAGGDRNFERPNVEWRIFQNLKIIWTLKFGFYFNFNASIFYNFQNLIFFLIFKVFSINKFCKFVN